MLPPSRPILLACLWILSCSTTPPTFQKTVMSSGLTIVAHAVPATRLAAVQINVRGGLSAEPKGKEGLAYLTANLLFRGTAHRSNEEIIAELEFLSARVTIAVNPDFTSIRLVCLAENFDAAWAIVAECLTQPLLDSLYFELQKVGLQNEIAAAQDNMTSVAETLMWTTMYSGHGYGHPTGGRVESLRQLTLEDVRQCYHERYTAANTVIALVAGEEIRTIQDSLLEKLNDYARTGSVWKAQPPSAHVPASARVDREKLQAVLIQGYAVPGIAAGQFPVIAVATQILGGGIGSRLWQLRQQDQLAYAVNARYDQFQYGGAIRVMLGTTAIQTDRARVAMDSVIRQFGRGGVTDEELRSAKSILLADALRSSETSTGRIARMSYFEMTGLGADYDARFGDELDNVTAAMVNERVESLLTLANRVDVIAGPPR